MAAYADLSHGIVAVCVRSQVRRLIEAKKIGLHRELVELLRDKGADTLQIPWRAAIETYDNLNTAVFSEILTTAGCDSTPYVSQRAVIDEKLLRHRNRIAHNGSDPELDAADYAQLHEQIVALIQCVRDDFENAATTRTFERMPTRA